MLCGMLAVFGALLKKIETSGLRFGVIILTRGRLVVYTPFEYSSNIRPSTLPHYKRKRGTLCNSPNLFLMTSHPCSDHKALTYYIDKKIIENKNFFRKHGRITFSPFVAKKSKKCFTLLFTLGIKCSEFGHQECHTFFCDRVRFCGSLVMILIFKKCATLKRLAEH